MKSVIHKTAIIDPKAKIDTGVEIGPYCIVRKGVRISKGTKLVSHVIIEGNTAISENCTFYPFSSIGFPPQDLKYRGEPTKLIIGSNNIVREYVVPRLARKIYPSPDLTKGLMFPYALISRNFLQTIKSSRPL